ncbi:DUF6083 domain-containing protein [Streptomyces albicerus]|uniref:DUF6083 domain-containing protein n=1 Tax=Streptomyces albicerus TaxID=2569859 RepID=UPI001CEC529F|nr:DUF6083 domain-containing protein [Streptomyces albicerus]
MPSSSSSPRRWDRSSRGVHHRRSLRLDPGGASRLLRCGQRDRCRDCGNPIEWYLRGNEQPVRLHPRELPAAAVPESCRWHVSSGVAHPAGDGSAWCRLPHAVVCPARDADPATVSGLAALRRSLAVNMRRLVDSGVFEPSASPDNRTMPTAVCRPARPIVQLLYVRYLAARPVDEIQCVAQTRRRQRCPHTLAGSDGPAGRWTLVPATAERGQLALPATAMAVYDLTALPYEEQLRWRTQRCAQHAATPAAADLAVAEWERFDPYLHLEHICTRLPTRNRHSGPEGRASRPIRL